MIEALNYFFISWIDVRLLLLTAAGTFAGIYIGAIPGLSVTMAVSILISFTFKWEVNSALALTSTPRARLSPGRLTTVRPAPTMMLSMRLSKPVTSSRSRRSNNTWSQPMSKPRLSSGRKSGLPWKSPEKPYSSIRVGFLTAVP